MSTTFAYDKDEILRLRKEILHETQEAFAARLGVNQSTIAHWEAGNRAPSGPANMLLEQLFGAHAHAKKRRR